MAWCFSTRASVATVLTTHPCVSRCLRVKTFIFIMRNPKLVRRHIYIESAPSLQRNVLTSNLNSSLMHVKLTNINDFNGAVLSWVLLLYGHFPVILLFKIQQHVAKIHSGVKLDWIWPANAQQCWPFVTNSVWINIVPYLTWGIIVLRKNTRNSK